MTDNEREEAWLAGAVVAERKIRSALLIYADGMPEGLERDKLLLKLRVLPVAALIASVISDLRNEVASSQTPSGSRSRS